jgi:parallel beta helix pectate lyase-like protein
MSSPYRIGPRRWRTVVTVREPTRKAIQEALDQAGAASIVFVPAGHYALDGPLLVRNDDVLLLGAGAGSLDFGSTADGSAAVLGAALREGNGRPMVHVRGARRFEISGLRFEGTADEGSQTKDVGVLLEDAEDFRVDHSYFTHLGFAGVRTNGISRGVVDHCSFFAQFKPAIGTDGYGVAVYGTDALTGIALGEQGTEETPEATVVEDCRFAQCRHAIASNKGARYVFRNNYVTSGVVAHAIDVHGAEFGSTVGGEWIDVHDNVIEQPLHDAPYYDRWAVKVRGGRGVVWNNTFRGYRVGVELTEDTTARCGPVFVAGNRLEPETGTMVDARPGLRGVPPEFSLDRPAGYRPHPSPHPLARTQCGKSAPTHLGNAEVCPED